MIGEEVGRGRRQHAARGRFSEAGRNLAPAHAACNSEKSNRPPKPVETVRLARRNAAIMSSAHPLRRTLDPVTGYIEDDTEDGGENDTLDH
jgi:hypothetical protein